jgi:WD40 repeat protein
MNADGSNKIVLTKETGSYRILGWSPDGQKIVYENQQPDEANGETRLQVVSIDGLNMEWLLPENIEIGIPRQIHWESDEEFFLISYYDTTPLSWQLTRFFVNNPTQAYNGFGPILARSKMPFLAIFENTYVTLDKDSLVWFSYKGAPISYASWKMDSACETKVIFDLQKSPDGDHGFVSVYCEGGSTNFFLVNSDGSEIEQLGATLDNITPLPFSAWSPDGRYVIVSIAGRQDQELYLLDIEKMKNDPSTQPIQLTTDGAGKYGAAWQPRP